MEYKDLVLCDELSNNNYLNGAFKYLTKPNIEIEITEDSHIVETLPIDGFCALGTIHLMVDKNTKIAKYKFRNKEDKIITGNIVLDHNELKDINEESQQSILTIVLEKHRNDFFHSEDHLKDRTSFTKYLNSLENLLGNVFAKDKTNILKLLNENDINFIRNSFYIYSYTKESNAFNVNFNIILNNKQNLNKLLPEQILFTHLNLIKTIEVLLKKDDKPFDELEKITEMLIKLNTITENLPSTTQLKLAEELELEIKKPAAIENSKLLITEQLKSLSYGMLADEQLEKIGSFDNNTLIKLLKFINNGSIENNSLRPLINELVNENQLKQIESFNNNEPPAKEQIEHNNFLKILIIAKLRQYRLQLNSTLTTSNNTNKQQILGYIDLILSKENLKPLNNNELLKLLNLFKKEKDGEFISKICSYEYMKGEMLLHAEKFSQKHTNRKKSLTNIANGRTSFDLIRITLNNEDEKSADKTITKADYDTLTIQRDMILRSILFAACVLICASTVFGALLLLNKTFVNTILPEKTKSQRLVDKHTKLEEEIKGLLSEDDTSAASQSPRCA